MTGFSADFPPEVPVGFPLCQLHGDIFGELYQSQLWTYKWQWDLRRNAGYFYQLAIGCMVSQPLDRKKMFPPLVGWYGTPSMHRTLIYIYTCMYVYVCFIIHCLLLLSCYDMYTHFCSLTSYLVVSGPETWHRIPSQPISPSPTMRLYHVTTVNWVLDISTHWGYINLHTFAFLIVNWGIYGYHLPSPMIIGSREDLQETTINPQVN